MKRFGDTFGNRKHLLLSAAGLAALAIPVLVGALGAPFLRAQSGTTAKLQFEVASVKPADLNAIDPQPGALGRTPRISGDKVVGRRMSVSQLIVYAYNIRPWQMTGDTRLPNPPNTFDIDAKVEGFHSEDDVRLMFQSLLRDRFNLKTHWETKMLDSYRLTVAKGGTKLKSVSPHGIVKLDIYDLPVREGKLFWMVGADGAHLRSNAAPIGDLQRMLIVLLQAPVVDETGLQGTYDYAFDFTPDDSPPDAQTDFPPITTALKRETGLTLEKAKLPGQILVVDHVEKPSPN